MTGGTIKWAIALVLVVSACGSSGGDAADTAAGADSAAPTPTASSAPESSVPATEPTETTPPETTTAVTTPPETDAPVETTAAAAAVIVEPGPQPPAEPAAPTVEELSAFSWTTTAPDAPWQARAGLRVVDLDGRLILLGGRTPNQSTIPGDSTIWADVWASDDGGATWFDLLDGATAPWPARAYFQALVKDGMIYVIGGQDYGLEENPFCALLDQGLEPPPGLGIDPDAPCPEFLPTSRFFNDVWRSADGITWEEVTASAPWDPRAGLSSAVLGEHLYVLAGSQNDDSSIIGAGGPARLYYQDVWRSTDGADWELMTDAAPWEPRAGAVTVVRDDKIFLFGGEDGFTCEPLPDCEAPYFNDVWVTADGATWELVTEAAGWSPRPGHVCELVGNQFLCFGGFGLLVNPTDMWVSDDGAEWSELPTNPWGSSDPLAMRYDFDALVVDDPETGRRVLTFGGDRETFDFTDPENYLRVDNDVWTFALPMPG
jgi:hypothetical protein